MEEKSFKNAKKVYETLCGALDSIGWRYDRHDDDFIVTLGVNGEDIPMWLVLGVDADKELIRCMSRIPVEFDSENMVDGSIACAYATWRIIDGRFALDISKGEVNFEIASSFAGSLISKELIKYLVGTAVNTIDDFNDGIVAVANGSMSIGDFCKL